MAIERKPSRITNPRAGKKRQPSTVGKKPKSAKGMSLSQIQAQLNAYNKAHKNKKNKRIS